MKKLIHISILLSLILIENAYSQTPTYNLRAMNFRYYGCPAKIIEFDIYIEHTNPPVYFEYVSGQFYFNFNSAIGNGGTMTLSKTDSEINPLFQNDVFSVSGSQLRIPGAVPFPPAGSGHMMTGNGYPGTKILGLRLTTSAGYFANVPLNLVWRSALPNPFTKIVAYVNGSVVEIQTPATHFIVNDEQSVCELFNLNLPVNFNQNVSSPASLSWYRANNALFYKLHVATDNSFSNIVYNDSNITDTFRVVPLSSNQNYYWKVFAGNNSGYYLTSKVWNFKTPIFGPGGTPTYTLTAKNINLIGPQDNQLTFDIYVQHTNPPTIFEYAWGQYMLNINPLIANGGVLFYEIIASDLPVQSRPRNPTVRGDSLLLLASNDIPDPGNGFDMTNNGFPGTKIVTMKLSTTAPQFAIENLNLRWRNSPQSGIVTKLAAMINQLAVEITTPGTHFVEFSNPLPVELSAFLADVGRQTVNLKWTTSGEINNSGFEIERSGGASNEFKKIGFIIGNGTFNSPVNYEFTDRNLSSGKYKYRLKQIDYNGSYSYYDLKDEVAIGIPDKFELSQNYPNPFNPSTAIDYTLPSDANVSIKLYDIAGRELMTLLNETKHAGYYTLRFNASNLSSGMYFYRLTAKTMDAIGSSSNENITYSVARRMTLIK